MKGFLWAILALFVPWFVFLLKDNPGGALVALVMQATIIGWIPASMWAWKVVHEKRKKSKME